MHSMRSGSKSATPSARLCAKELTIELEVLLAVNCLTTLLWSVRSAMPAAASATLRQLKLLFAANPGATVCSGRLEPSPFSDLLSSSMIARIERRPRGAGCAKGPSRVNLQQFHNFSSSQAPQTGDRLRFVRCAQPSSAQSTDPSKPWHPASSVSLALALYAQTARQLARGVRDPHRPTLTSVILSQTTQCAPSFTRRPSPSAHPTLRVQDSRQGCEGVAQVLL